MIKNEPTSFRTPNQDKPHERSDGTPPFEVLQRLFQLGLTLDEGSTINRTVHYFSNEIANILARKVVWTIVFDDQYETLATFISSKNHHDHLAFERHLAEPREVKLHFYEFLDQQRDRDTQGGLYIDTNLFFEQLNSVGVQLNPPIWLKSTRPKGNHLLPEFSKSHFYTSNTFSEILGAYWVKRARDKKITVVFYLGGSEKAVSSTLEESNQIERVVELLLEKYTSIITNQYKLKVLTEDGAALKKANQLTLELLSNAKEITQKHDIKSKLTQVCKAIAHQPYIDCAFLITIGAEQTIEDLAVWSKNNMADKAEEFLYPISKKKKLPERFWESVTLHGEGFFGSYVVTDLVFNDEKSVLFYPEFAEALRRAGHRQTEQSITFFTPIFDFENQWVGFVSYSLDSVPLLVEELVRAVQWLVQFLEKDIQFSRYKLSSLQQFRQRKEIVEQSSLNKLQEAIGFSKSLSNSGSLLSKIEITLMTITQQAGVSMSLLRLFDANGEANELYFGNESGLYSPTEKEFQAEQSTAFSKVVLEAVLSCKGFEINGSYCFTLDQSKQVSQSISELGTVPINFQSPELVKDNFLRLGIDTDTLLVTPLRYKTYFIGYIIIHQVSKPLEMASHNALYDNEFFLQLSFYARELAREIIQLRLSEQSENRLQEIQFIRDISSSLVESARELQNITDEQKKVEFLSEAISEKFGFQHASVVLYDERGFIRNSDYYIHSQFSNQALELQYQHRYNIGAKLPQEELELLSIDNHLTDGSTTDSLKVGFFYVYRFNEVKEIVRWLKSGAGLPEKYAEKALKDYVDGLGEATIMLPILDERQKRIGHVGIGQLILTHVGAAKISLVERMKLVSVLVEQFSLSTRGFLATREIDTMNSNLLRSEARYRNLFENVSYGCIIFDSDGSIEFINAALKGMLGYSIESVRRTKLVSFASTKSMHLIQGMQESLMAGMAHSEAEIYLKKSSGEEIPFQISAVPQLLVGESGNLEIEGAFAVLVDLRPQYEIERKKNQLETIKNNFYAMVVHDMKVPLAAIYGYSELLKEAEPDKMNPENFQNIMHQIFISSVNITNLIQEILDFSKYESRAVSLDRALNDIQFCVELVLEQNQFSLSSKNIHAVKRFDPIDKFMFDFDRMTRVIANILSNAIKFSKNDSQIVLSLAHISIQNQPLIRFSVKDFGEGIPESELENIFDAYLQAKSKHGSRGTGLGLSIAKQIVELHGGDIWAESKEGEGATLVFTLPFTKI